MNKIHSYNSSAVLMGHIGPALFFKALLKMAAITMNAQGESHLSRGCELSWAFEVFDRGLRLPEFIVKPCATAMLQLICKFTAWPIKLPFKARKFAFLSTELSKKDMLGYSHYRYVEFYLTTTFNANRELL